MVPEVAVEPTRAFGPRDFESRASANSTTPAYLESLRAERSNPIIPVKNDYRDCFGAKAPRNDKKS